MGNELMTFLQMGGYGSYVWSAYGVVVIVFLGNFMAARKKHKQILQKIEKQ